MSVGQLVTLYKQKTNMASKMVESFKNHSIVDHKRGGGTVGLDGEGAQLGRMGWGRQ